MGTRLACSWTVKGTVRLKQSKPFWLVWNGTSLWFDLQFSDNEWCWASRNIHFLIQKHLLSMLTSWATDENAAIRESQDIGQWRGLKLSGLPPPSYREDASKVSGLHRLRWHSQDKNPAFLILRPGFSFQSSRLLPLWVPAKWWQRPGPSDKKSLTL